MPLVSPSTPLDWDHMMVPLVTACPSFGPIWAAFLDEWADNPLLDGEELKGRLPLYLVLTKLAQHLIGKLEAGATDDLPAVFQVVERWHVDGTPLVQEAATVGLLEDLQNEGFYRTARSDDFSPWLGPETRRWWHKVERFWSKGERLTDD